MAEWTTKGDLRAGRRYTFYISYFRGKCRVLYNNSSYAIGPPPILRKRAGESGVITGYTHLATDVWVSERCGVLGDPAVLQASLVRPLVRLLCLPRPHDPPARLFKRHDLRLPHLPQVRLVTLAE